MLFQPSPTARGRLYMAGIAFKFREPEQYINVLSFPVEFLASSQRSSSAYASNKKHRSFPTRAKQKKKKKKKKQLFINPIVQNILQKRVRARFLAGSVDHTH